ncbi:GNAT family N-acetyltransferase [Bacteroides fluxus]|jgi:ribosomal protein S18 acetylase RimI-like enzyme|uniref:Acetyltransferase, GNAT family n=1 Tax=Bacteroides fluxus YIT 12057 TaxID=763034 RepID=F3PR35_9BACE|nr:GNAT family N-acetyltransferase [Bacteroides fluxus]EGF58576.1 acetyltransferase, GNAT family [Bacteroides fluxus YIT 12057]MDY3788013.1 GNAT family N-acetyltransferase [Bacteroides fluxus]
MIRLQRITTADTALYDYMEQLMTCSFPSEEYRALEELRTYTDTKTSFHNNIIFQDDTPVGFITYWDFGHFFYVEHFAIDPAQRNGGHGKNVLNHLCQLLKYPIILEVEEPIEEMAQRRINFYQRHGFSLWEKPYQQPPYKPGDHFLPMLLMAYGDLQCERDFENVKEHIYKEVYNVK